MKAQSIVILKAFTSEFRNILWLDLFYMKEEIMETDMLVKCEYATSTTRDMEEDHIGKKEFIYQCRPSNTQRDGYHTVKHTLFHF